VTEEPEVAEATEPVAAETEASDEDEPKVSADD
jgi:hypothetical protein